MNNQIQDKEKIEKLRKIKKAFIYFQKTTHTQKKLSIQENIKILTNKSNCLLKFLLLKIKELEKTSIASNSNVNTKEDEKIEQNLDDEDLVKQDIFSKEELKFLSEEIFYFLREQPSLLTKGTLKNYQMAGLNWLISLYEMGVNGILADQMGLGKTIQTIAFLGYLKEVKKLNGKFLIVSPKSVIGNWHKELRKWIPKMKSIRLMAKKEDSIPILDIYVRTRKFEVLLTTYEGTVKFLKELNKIPWEYIIIDEAHCLKNETGQLSRTLRELNTKNKLLITGTPIQNNIQELWALLNFNMPEMFNDKRIFEKSNTSFKKSDNKEREKQNLEFIQSLHKIVNPFILKRSKKELRLEFPPKKEFQIHVGMSKIQLEIYKKILLKQPINSKNHASPNVLVDLRKCCNHPYLFKGVEPEDSDPCGEHLIETSGKMKVVDKLLKRLKGNHQILIFSQFTQMLDILEDYLRNRKFTYRRLDGKTTYESRQKAIEEFTQENSDVFVFLLSTRAGGLGINLMSADTVIIYDSDWNPQMDLQAMGRADRIGQRNEVMVYRLICNNTIEEKILERQKIKLKWDQLVILKGQVSQKQIKIGKEEMKDLVCHGSKEIFKMKPNDDEELDLDKILQRGERKTKELQTKVDNIMDLTREKAFDLEVEAINVFDLAKKEMYGQQNKEFIDKMRKEKKKENLISDEFSKNEYSANQIEIYDFQFFRDFSRIYYLMNKKKQLTSEEKEECEKINKEGFLNWTFYDFKTVLAYLEKGKENISEQIVKEMNKEKGEVQRFVKRFWAEIIYLENHKDILERFQKAQMKRENINTIKKAIKEKVYEIFSYKSIIFDSRFYSKSRFGLFTKNMDKFLIFQEAQNGLEICPEKLLNILKNHEEFKIHPKINEITSLLITKRINSLNKIIQNEFNYAILFNKQWKLNKNSQWIRENFNPILMGFSRALENDFGIERTKKIDFASILKKSQEKKDEFERMKQKKKVKKKKLKIIRKPMFNTRYYMKKKKWNLFVKDKKEKEKMIEEVDDQESTTNQNSQDPNASGDSNSSNEKDNAFKGISEFVKIKPSTPQESPKKINKSDSFLQKRSSEIFEQEEDKTDNTPTNILTKIINPDILLFNTNEENLKIQQELKRVSRMARDTQNLKSYCEKTYLVINSLLEDIREEGSNIGKAQKQAIESEIDGKMQILLNKINISKATKELEKEINLCKLKAESEFYLLEMNKKSEQERKVFLFFLNECAKRLPEAKSFIMKNMKDSDLTGLVSALIQSKEVNNDPELIKYIFSIKSQLWRWNYMNKLFKKSNKNKRSFDFIKSPTEILN